MSAQDPCPREYTDKVVASWPALTRAQLDCIAGLLNGTGAAGGGSL